ncbi:MAG TPA: sigma-70 family RNA polymerase sigma factor [Gemmatales bacterium]|nr:sigma-70 family RNA polymerase sigma factor [Gemmatales bacterium]
MQLLKTPTTLTSLPHDGQLLHQFAVKQDESAFVELLRRQGAMVLGVCRRILHHQQDAEDATQAVFLSLAQQANKLSGNRSLAAWLHCVARRTAGHALRQAQKRQKREQRVARPEAITAHDADAVRWLLDEELDRLPERYRLPVILCCIEGHTRQTAAELLGWPAGTVAGRLGRARAILQKRLTARGVALAAATGVMMPCGVSAISAPLLTLIGTQALRLAQGHALHDCVTPNVAAMMMGVGGATTFIRLTMVATMAMVGLVGWITMRGAGEPAVGSKPEVSFVSFIKSAPTEEQTDFQGTVLTEGKPVAGASVWLTGYVNQGNTGGYDEHLDTTKTDQLGQFRLRSTRRHITYVILARSVEGRFAYQRASATETTPMITNDLKLDLMPSLNAEGRIRNHRGEPVAGAKIIPQFVEFGDFDLRRQGMISRDKQLILPELLKPFWTTQTDGEGRLVLPGVPRQSSLAADIQLTHGEYVFLFWDVSRPADIQLPEMGEIVIRFKGVDDPDQLKKAAFYLSVNSGQSGLGLSYGTSRSIRGTSGLEMQVKGVFPGKGRLLRQENDESCPYYAVQLPSFEVKPGQTTEITLDMKPNVKVVGQVIDVQTQRGLARAEVEVVSFDPKTNSGYPKFVKTDENGNYVAYVKPGEVYAQLSFLPNNYVIEQFKIYDKIAGQVGQTVTFHQLKVKPGKSIHGEVVTTDGRPVPNARLFSLQLEYCHNYPRSQPYAITDAEGRFRIEQLTNDNIDLCVNSSEGVTLKAEIVDLTKPDKPIRIVVDKKNCCYITGQLVDQQGKPVKGVKPRLVWNLNDMGRLGGIGIYLEVAPTDADGRFRSGPLCPGERYQIQTDGEPIQQLTEQIIGKPGMTHDVGTVQIPLKPEKK